jgi:hypothetical protein
MVQDLDPLAVAQSRLMLLGMDPPELAGPVERLHSWFIDGPRRMPVRFRASH